MSVSTIAPAIDTHLEHRDIHLQCGENVQVRKWAALSLSNSQANFSMPPPSMRVFMSRYMIRHLQVQVALTSTGGTSLLSQAGNFAPRAFPIGSSIVNEQLTVNSQSFTLQTSDVIPSFSRYMGKKDIQTSPTFLDCYVNYVDGRGRVNNPLGVFSSSFPEDKCSPRGAFPYTVVSSAATALTLLYDFYEPVLIAPLLVEEFGSTLGFTNIRSLELVTNFQSDLTHIMSLALNGVTGLGVAVTIQAAEVFTTYTTPPPSYVPRPIAYRNLEISRFISQQSNIASGATSSNIVSQNLQLNCIPEFIMLSLRPNGSTSTYATADWVCNISNVNINFNNISGILSTSNEATLYAMSRENGLKDRFEVFHGYAPSEGGIVPTAGSWIKLMFGKDISLGGASEFVGKVGSYNLQVTLTATNQSGGLLTTPELVALVGYPSKLILHESGEAEKVLGVREGEDGDYVAYDHLKGYYGGSFKDVMAKIGSFLRPINDFLKKTKLVSNIASNIPLPMAQQIGEFAKIQGYGMGGMHVGGDGGKIMSRAELKKRLAGL